MLFSDNMPLVAFTLALQVVTGHLWANWFVLCCEFKVEAFKNTVDVFFEGMENLLFLHDRHFGDVRDEKFEDVVVNVLHF